MKTKVYSISLGSQSERGKISGRSVEKQEGLYGLLKLVFMLIRLAMAMVALRGMLSIVWRGGTVSLVLVRVLSLHFHLFY
jgi:hypothetical protein